MAVKPRSVRPPRGMLWINVPADLAGIPAEFFQHEGRWLPFLFGNTLGFHEGEALRTIRVFRIGDALGALATQAEIPAPAEVMGVAAFPGAVVKGSHRVVLEGGN